MWRRRERERGRVRGKDVVLVDAADVVAATVDADALSQLPSSRIPIALALQGPSVPILAIAVATNFPRSLATRASSRCSR